MLGALPLRWRRPHRRAARDARDLDRALLELAAAHGELADAHAELADAHAELARRQSFTDALLETIEVGIVSCDADGVINVSNRAERELFALDTGLTGLSAEHLPDLIQVFDPAGRPIAPADYPLMRTLRGEDVTRADVLVGAAGGAQREVVVRGSQIRGASGELLGAVAALTDVTAERTAERALAAERRTLDDTQRLGQLGGFEYDAVTETWAFSDQMCALWGVPAGGFSVAHFRALIDPTDGDRAREFWDAHLRVAGHHSEEFHIHRADDGAARVLRSRIVVLLGADGEPVQVRGTHLDITDLVLAQRESQRANAFSDAILAASPDDTLVSNLETGAIVYASPGKHILGRTTAELTTLDAAGRAGLVHPDDRQRMVDLDVAAAHLDDGQPLQLRFRGRHADGSWRWLTYCVTPFRRDPSGAVVEILAVISDVTELVRAEELLVHAALHDTLTGLPNRALLAEAIDAALERSRSDGREVAILFCDLDGFKHVNDTGGHSAGDAVLAETARRLRGAVRAQDTVARVGGDEFVIVVEPWSRDDDDDYDGVGVGVGVGDPQPARALSVVLAERITAALREPIRVRGRDHVISASIGITYATLGATRATTGSGWSAEASRGRRDVTVDEVLHHADAAMYRAKDGGKDRYEISELTSG